MAKTKALVPVGGPMTDSLMTRAIRMLAWRLDRLERQVQTLTELVRDHAEDADRLVRIVAEDHEALRQELIEEHQQRLSARKARKGGRKRAR